MKQFIYLSLLCFLGVVCKENEVYSQTTYSSSLTLVNPVMLSPALCGAETKIAALANVRQQWAGITEAPKSYNLWFEYGKFEKGSLGLIVNNTSAGLLNQLNIKGTYAYKLKLAEHKNVLMGVNIGIVQYLFKAQDAKVKSTDDPFLINGNQASTAFTCDFGVAYTSKQLTLGVTIPQLYTSSLLFGSDNAGLTPSTHYQVYGLYKLKVQEKWSLHPFIMYRGMQSSHTGLIDAGVRTIYKEDVGLGLLYKTNFGLQASVDVNLTKHIQIQYAFGLASGKIATASSSSHEFGLRFSLK